MPAEASDTGKLSQSGGQTRTATTKSTPIHGISNIPRRQLREGKDIRTGGKLNAMSYGEGAFSAGSGQGLLPRREQ